MPPAIAVRPMEARHAEGVLAVCAQGIATGDATSETAVSGWVAVRRVGPRPAYAGVVEHSVYVADAARGRGVGAAPMRRLPDSCDAGGIRTVQTGVFPENTASLALHERFGFRRVGVREGNGQREGRWRDVVLLERRSPVVGR